MEKAEVDWNALDKRKFFVNGVFIFTGLTGCLFPLTVIKTRMMAMDGGQPGQRGGDARAHNSFRGIYTTARDVVRVDGYRGLYKGFGTVVGGLIPGRMVYLGVLEATKKAVSTALEAHESDIPEAAVASASSFIAGATASLAGQLIAVPVDVISQRQMIDKGTSGLRIARDIVAKRGFIGLYQGLGASILTFGPSSALWWSAYGAYQSLLWSWVDRYRGVQHASMHDAVRSEREIVCVQVLSGIVTGCTTSFLTNPLDVVKTRVQTRDVGSTRESEGTWRGTARALYAREGMRGFFRGVLPRMASASVWGTTMVNAYEILKRSSTL
jgi:solute carrier family 25 protein 44